MPTIIGIDPGSRCTGYGIIAAKGSVLTCIGYGEIKSSASELSERLLKIFNQLLEVIGNYSPQESAIEQVFMHQNPQSALKLGQARGAALVALAQHGLAVGEYSPRQIKQAVVGYGAAEKSQVQHMVKSLLQLKVTPSTDAADALAVAICHNHTTHLATRLARSRITAGEGS